MDTIQYLTSPVIATATILVIVFAIGVALNIFFEKTETGTQIQNKTPWMGWTENEEDPYFGFRIHNSNYARVNR